MATVYNLRVLTGVDYVADAFAMLIRGCELESVCYTRPVTPSASNRLFFLFNDSSAMERGDPACVWNFAPLGDSLTLIACYCRDPNWEPFCKGVMGYFLQLFPADEQDTKKRHAPRKLGLHGGTLDRVREAKELIDQGRAKTKTEACKRVGIDKRTYDRYVDLFVDWGAENGFYR